MKFSLSIQLLLALTALSAHNANGTSIEIQNTAFSPPHHGLLYGLNPLPWIPNGDRSSLVPAECDPSQIEKGQPTPEAYQAYIQRCEKELNRQEPSGLNVLINLASVTYPALSNPLVREIKIRLDNGLILTGYLGLKQTRERRPLVVALCGLFCNAGDPMAATFMTQLFEESPFHVLVLGNPTASDFVRDNHVPALGGNSDGKNLLEVVKFLRSAKSPFKNRIASVHLVGQSLGSQGVLFASLFDSENVAKGQPRQIQSTIAVCPVIDLQGTLDYLQNEAGTIASLIYKDEISSYLRAAYPEMPILRDMINLEASYSLPEYIDIFLRATVAHQASHPAIFGVNSLTDFWQKNNFLSYLSGLSTPAMILNSDDDFLVSARENSLRVPNHPYLKVVRFAEGSHCGMAISSGWETLTRIMRSFVLAHSSEFRPSEPRILAIPESSLGGPWHSPAKLTEAEVLRKVDWSFSPSTQELKLNLTISKGTQIECQNLAQARENGECLRRGRISLPLSLFPEISTLITNLDDYAKSRILRWARANIEVLDANGQFAITSGKEITALRIKGI